MLLGMAVLVKNNGRGYKPSSVLENQASIIYLSSLPPEIERATLNCRYIWPCRSQKGTTSMSPQTYVGSYPTFSPLPISPKGFVGGYFLLPLS